MLGICNRADNRILWIDVARTIAIMMTVMCHSVWGIYDFQVDSMSSLSSINNIFAFGVFSLARMGVPIFFMMSGYLLLDKTYTQQAVKEFWVKKVLHLFLCAEFWIIAYQVIKVLYVGTAFKWDALIREMLFVGSFSMSHTWYLPILLGIYLLIPFVANAINKISTKMLVLPLAVFGALNFIPPILNAIFRINHIDTLVVKVSEGFSGGAYGIYLLLGYVIKKNGLKKINSWFLGLVLLCSVIGATWFQYWAYSCNLKYNTWYDNPMIFLGAVSLFELLSRMKKVYCAGMFRTIAYFSFPIYLIFNIWTYVLLKVVNRFSVIMPIKTIIYWLLILMAGFVCSVIISLIPKFGKYILYLK